MTLCPVANWSRESPEALALPNVSYRELDQLIKRLCYPLSKIQSDLLAFIPKQTSLDIAFFFAAWRMGKALYPISFRHPDEAVKKRLKQTKATFVNLLEIQCSDPLNIETVDENSLATLIETSSSEKIVCHNLYSHLISAKTCATALNLSAGDRYCLNLPLFHVAGIATMLRTFVARATLVFPGDSATHISMVPTQLFRQLNQQLPHLKCLLVGGAPLPEKLYQEALSLNLPIYCSYGMTESASMVLIKPPGGSISALPHIQVRRSEEGELLLKGPSMLHCYFGHEPIKGWFSTRDIVNEQLMIIGRKDRQFISGGENINPEEIEAALLQLEHVIEARVEPEEDKEFGMRPIATLYCSREISVEDILKNLEKKLPRFKVPKKILTSTSPFSSKQSSLTKIFI